MGKAKGVQRKQTLEGLLYRMGIRYVAYHEDDSVAFEVSGIWYQAKKVSLNKDGSIRKNI